MKDASSKKARNWSVAWICSFVGFLQMGIPRMSGLLYLATISRYNANRSQASLPFVLCYSVRNVAGPLIGYLGKRIGAQKVIFYGCVLSTVGVGACFFAEDIIALTALWGILFGMGFGMSTILIPEVLNQNFDKYLSNANGIAFGGECVAGFVLPPLLEFLLNTYGLSGTFLISSGLILHSIPAALFFIPKGYKTDQKNNATNDNTEERLMSEHDHEVPLTSSKTTQTCRNTEANNQVYHREAASDTEKFMEDHLINSSLINANIRCDHSSMSRDADEERVKPSDESPLVTNQPVHLKPHATMQSASDYISKTCDSHSNGIIEHYHSTVAQCDNLQESNKPVVKRCDVEESLMHQALSESIDISRPAQYAFRVFLDPPFILILFVQSSLIFIATTVTTIIVDYCLDIGVRNADAVYVLMCLSIADMLGRLGLGWITDGGHLSSLAFSCLCYTGMGAILVLCVLFQGFVMVMVTVFFVGLFIGGLLIVFPGIISDYIEEDNVTMALASRLFLYAPMSLMQSSMIGYFRETLGSYEGIFYLLGAHCLTCTALSLLIPCAARSRDKMKKFPRTPDTRFACNS